MADGDGAKTGWAQSLKDHPYVVLPTLLLSGVVGLAQFLDTDTGRQVRDYFFEGQGGSVSKDGNLTPPIKAESSPLPPQRALTPSTLFAPISLSGDGTPILARKASGLESALSVKLGARIAGGTRVKAALSDYSGRVGSQSVTVVFAFETDGETRTCGAEFVEFGSDAELERILTKLILRGFDNYQGGGSC